MNTVPPNQSLSACLLSLLFHTYHRKRVSLWCLPLSLLLFINGSCHRPFHPFPPKTSLLRSDRPVQKALRRGESDQYLIRPDKGQYLRVKVAARGIDLTGSLFFPNGLKSAEFSFRENTTVEFSVIADETGSYSLTISPSENEEMTGSYDLAIQETRSVEMADKEIIAGERAFAAAVRLSQQEKAESSLKAITYYKDAYSRFLVAGNRNEAARAIKAAGDIHYFLGQPQTALCLYDLALSLCLSTHSQALHGDILSALSYAQTQFGNYPQAVAYASQAVSLSRDACDSTGEIQALNNLGLAFYGIGNRWKAREYHQEAIGLLNHLNDRRIQAQTLLYLGYVACDLGETEEASAFYNQAFHLWQSVASRNGIALTQAAQAVLACIQGKEQEALNLYNQALPVVRDTGDRFWEGCIIQNIGSLYFFLGDYTRALSSFEEGLKIWRLTVNKSDEAGALSAIGQIHHLMGDNKKALLSLNSARSLAESLSDEKILSFSLHNIGQIHASSSTPDKAIGFYQRALLLHRKNGSRQGEAAVLNDLGRVYLKLQHPALSFDFFNQALSINRKRGDLLSESETLRELAGIELSRGRLNQAGLNIEKALGIAESLRASIESQSLRSSYFALVQQNFEFQINLLMHQHEKSPRGAFAGKALEVSERSRARSLLELLTESSANIRTGADRNQIEREKKLRNQIATIIEHREQLLKIITPPEEIKKLSREIDALTMELDRLETLIRTESPHYAALTQPQPLSLGEIQQLLDNDSLLLEYALGNEQSYLWAMTRTDLKSYRLPGRREIEGIARKMYDLLSGKNSVSELTTQQREDLYWRQADQLSRIVLQPLLDHPTKKHLVIVADGALQYIPFAALRWPVAAKHRKDGNNQSSRVPLIANGYDVSYLPSASSLAVLRREMKGRAPAPRTIAVLADPVYDADDLRVIGGVAQKNDATTNQAKAFGQPASAGNTTRDGLNLRRLHFSGQEASAIEEITTPTERLVARGFEASRSLAVSPELSRYRIIHFATHGQLDLDTPELSAIVLSRVDAQGKPQDGSLRLGDIYNLNLRAELVVLSACETGLGKEIRGEGLVGLTRGFMYAGAARVIASLWKVEDRSTALLMKRFYRYLLRDCLSPAESLKQAQLDLLKDEQWHAPWSWAPFVLQGEWN